MNPVTSSFYNNDLAKILNKSYPSSSIANDASKKSRVVPALMFTHPHRYNFINYCNIPAVTGSLSDRLGDNAQGKLIKVRRQYIHKNNTNDSKSDNTQHGLHNLVNRIPKNVVETKGPQKQEQHTFKTTSSQFNNELKVFPKKINAEGSKQTTHNNDDNSTLLNPKTIINSNKANLTASQKEEILQYPKIWYFNFTINNNDDKQQSSPNDVYDDENGSYLYKSHDHIAYRYEVLQMLGQGSFGQVVKAYDHQCKTTVAVKIIRNRKRFHQQAKIEVMLLRHLKELDQLSEEGINVVHLLDDFVFRNHPCIVFELLEENLYEMIKRNNYRGLSSSNIQKVSYSLLTCLSALKKENIIHCDIKPENIMIKNRVTMEIKLIDFGSSCYSHEKVYTYIQSRFYRSPEIMLGIPYTTQIDMWSLGCVLPELMTGFPIFPGENEMDQLNCIHEIFGLPPKSVMGESTRKKLFYGSNGDPRSLINSRGRKRIPDSQTLLSKMRISCVDERFLDLISKCLRWNSKKRLTPDQALNHEWFQNYRLQQSTPSDIGLVLKRSNRPGRQINRRKNKDIENCNVSTGTSSDKENLPPIITNGKYKTDNQSNIGGNHKMKFTEPENDRVEFPTLYR